MIGISICITSVFVSVGSPAFACIAALLAASHTKLTARIDRIESKTADLGQKVGGLRPPTAGGADGIICNYCHEKGHVVANCPVLKAKNAKEAEKAKED